MKPVLFQLVVLSLAITYGGVGWPLELETNSRGGFGNWILIVSGEIQKGDFEKFRKFIVDQDNGLPPMIIIEESPGGNIYEALRIGQVITEGNINVIIGGSCASSCLFLVYAANDRRLSGFGDVPSVTIHRPTFRPEGFSKLTQEEARNKYQDLEGKVKGFLSSRNVPSNLTDLMFSTKSTNTIVMPATDLLDQIGVRDAAYEEWLIAKCGDEVTPEENEVLWAQVKNNGVCPQKPESYCEFLDAKVQKKRHCDREAIGDSQVLTYFYLSFYSRYPEKFRP